MFLLPGRTAARFRLSAGDLVCRYLGGDTSLADEVKQLAAHQKELPDKHFYRLFGEYAARKKEPVLPPGVKRMHIAQLNKSLGSQLAGLLGHVMVRSDWEKKRYTVVHGVVVRLMTGETRKEFLERHSLDGVFWLPDTL